MTTNTNVADPAVWNLPDSEICTAALQLVHNVSPAFLANHCVRSYLFGRELATAQGLRAGADYDEELVFLACALHDLGITEYGGGSQRFEVDGADAAVRFLREHNVTEDRLTPVWQAIALHTSVGLAHRFGPEQSVTHFGISLDINGFGTEQLPPGFAERVHAAFPRHDLGYAITDLIAQGTAADPTKAPPFSFPAHVHELINGGRLTFLDVVAASPWGDRPR
ncbi:HD domain-containing protein [Mycolicibacterium rutilum]|uniref:HD domain-containing protein n=1 Tax=Mycolicibacterium rutilum TaxID=370526 RepID=A0A1H6J1L5_MYCRU|nr:HD domain-containing protein [Mycolicibacterium rutilum]SEH53362.1 HD domain-containing protein [Mycolicibacterium rutilum]